MEFEGESKEEAMNVLDVTIMDVQDIYLANGFSLEDLNCLKFED